MTALKNGTRTCRCPTCAEHFSAVKTFDIHRIGPWADRRCMTAREMAEAGLERNARGIWGRPEQKRHMAARYAPRDDNAHDRHQGSIQ